MNYSNKISYNNINTSQIVYDCNPLVTSHQGPAVDFSNKTVTILLFKCIDIYPIFTNSVVPVNDKSHSQCKYKSHV